MREYDFEDDIVVKVSNKIVHVFEGDKKVFSVSGFSSSRNAHTFANFGDLETRGSDNVYIAITKSSENLIWEMAN
ncbi:MAG: hypothetical protein ACQEQR_00400 [Pseudomonadota bacterium]